jgi:hypothetical protein
MAESIDPQRAPVRVLWRRGAIVRVEMATTDAETYVRGVAAAIGLTGLDAEAWTAAVLAGGSGLIGLKLRDQAAVFHELDIVVLTRGVDSVPAGTRGCVVGVYGGRPAGYEIECEFVDGGGVTIAVVTVGEGDIRLAED